MSLSYNVIDGNGGSVAASQSYSLAAVNDAPTGSATAALAQRHRRHRLHRQRRRPAGRLQRCGWRHAERVRHCPASNGSVVDNGNGTFTITPRANYNGAVSLSYNVIDGHGGSVAANQSYSLAAVNDAPTGSATAALANGTEDTAYTVSAADLLTGFSDVDGDTLSVSALSSSNGSVIDNGNGTFTITPSANYNGAVSLSYNVVDGHGGTIAASQSYSLAAVNDAPTGSATAALAQRHRRHRLHRQRRSTCWPASAMWTATR